MIVAHPLDDASSEVLPNGSSHLDGTTAISALDADYDLDNDGDGLGSGTLHLYCEQYLPEGFVDNNIDINDDFFCESNQIDEGIIAGLYDDLNTPKVIAQLNIISNN